MLKRIIWKFNLIILNLDSLDRGLCELCSCLTPWLKDVSDRTLLAYLLIVWSWVLEKITGSQLVNKFPAFYGTLRFITAFTSARHLTLSWASSIQSISHILKIHLNIIVPSAPGFSKWSLIRDIRLHLYLYVFIMPQPDCFSKRPKHVASYCKQEVSVCEYHHKAT